MEKLAIPLITPIRERWSPRAFLAEPVSDGELAILFEAARWAASSYNEQPWRFIVAHRSEPHFTLLADCLVEANHWAANAPVLLLTIARHHFTKSGSPNPHAWHDVGLAMGNLSLQATTLGLQIHQMAGFAPDRARSAFAIPSGFDPVAMAAIGRPGDPQQLPEKLRVAEAASRERRPLGELVFGQAFGSRASCVMSSSSP